jgi:hypothetical protein
MKQSTRELIIEILKPRPIFHFSEHELDLALQDMGKYASGSSISRVCRRLAKAEIIGRRIREGKNYNEYWYIGK